MGRTFVELPGVRVALLDSGGSGAPVVFLHANTGTSASWAPQLGAFERAGYRTIAFDGRGCGESIPVPDNSPQPASMEDDLDALVATLGLSPFHIIGAARGAICALGFGSARPGLVRSLVAVGSLGCPEEPEIAEFRGRIRVEALERPERVADRELSAGYRGSQAAGVSGWLEIEASSHRRGAPIQPPTRSPNTYLALEAIEAPVLAVAGGADLVAPPTLTRLWSSHLREVDNVVIDDAGHAIAWEQPEWFNELVIDYLARHD